MIIFIYGEDSFRSKRKLKDLRKKYLQKYGDINISVYEDDFQIDKIKNDISSLPFLADKRLIIFKNLLKTKDKNLKDIILAELEKNTDDIVLVFYEAGLPDKRESLYKKLSKEKFKEEFPLLDPGSLLRWMKKEVEEKGGSISHSALSILASFVGNDLWQMEQELNKLLSFTKNIDEDAVKELIKKEAKGNIFDLVDAVGKRDYKTSALKLHELLESGENEILILTMLVRQIRIIIQSKELIEKGQREMDISKALACHPFVVKKAVIQSGNFTFEELKDIYKMLLETDHSLKRGTKEPKVALDLLIKNLC